MSNSRREERLHLNHNRCYLPSADCYDAVPDPRREERLHFDNDGWNLPYADRNRGYAYTTVAVISPSADRDDAVSNARSEERLHFKTMAVISPM